MAAATEKEKHREAEERPAIETLNDELLARCILSCSEPQLLAAVSSRLHGVVQRIGWLLWYDRPSIQILHHVAGRPPASGPSSALGSMIEPSLFPGYFQFLTSTRAMAGTSSTIRCSQETADGRCTTLERRIVAFMLPGARQSYLLVTEVKRQEEPAPEEEEEATLHLYSARWPRPAELMYGSVTPEASLPATLLFTTRPEAEAATIFNSQELTTLRKQSGIPERWTNQATIQVLPVHIW